jgi:lysophospholipase L1-like esterase
MTISKTFIFKVGSIVVPLLLILGCELVLYLFNLYPPPPLFVPVIKSGHTVYQVNTNFPERYISPRQATIPVIFPDVFDQNKSSTTIRIFTLGGSTTAGFPYDFQVSFPQQLEIMLSGSFPDRKFEIINLGISAINSFSVYDLLPEILDKDPDLIIIYMGHNEFYGVYGSASTFTVPFSGALIRFYLKLQNLRMVQGLKHILNYVLPARKLQSEHETFMETTMADMSVQYHSEKYKRTLANFRTNLELILGQCQDKKIPVLISDLVSNIREFPPFRSLPETFEQEALSGRLTAIDSLSGYHPNKGHVHGNNLSLSPDNLSAEAWFQAGKNSLVRGDTVRAKYYLEGARDRDLIPFRASSEINDIIKQSARKYNCDFINMEKEFSNNSADGIIGDELTCDHLHPNADGYFLMAKTFYQVILKNKLFGQPDSNFVMSSQPYHVTAMDRNIGILKVRQITGRPPFPPDYPRQEMVGDSLAIRYAQEYIYRKKTWVQAHYALADEYLKDQEFTKARQEYEAVSAFYSDDPAPFLLLARVYELQGELQQCSVFYQKALLTSDQQGAIYFQLALIEHKMKDMDEAILYMTRAVHARDLTLAERSSARLYLAGFLYDVFQIDAARRTLQELLQENPGFTPGINFLKKIEESGNKK